MLNDTVESDFKAAGIDVDSDLEAALVAVF
jgi:hypothetical protein